MEQKTLMDALVQMKRTGNLLNELLDLTQQLGQAIDRNDQVSIQLLIAMREEPLEKLQAADQAIRDQLLEVPDPEQSAHLARLLNGEPAAEDQEKLLCEQVAANRRRLKQVVDLDRMLNQRMAREKSAYE